MQNEEPAWCKMLAAAEMNEQPAWLIVGVMYLLFLCLLHNYQILLAFLSF